MMVGASSLPPRLNAGDWVGIASPSSVCDDEALTAGRAYLENCGYRIFPGRGTLQPRRGLAGSDGERAAELQELLCQPEVRAIFCARGGYGSARILEMLDFSVLQRQPKWLIGFSDSTALQLAVCSQQRLAVLSGAVIRDLAKPLVPPLLERSLWQGLHAWHFPPLPHLRTIREGQAKGVLLGGCLSLICSLIGTRWLPDLRGQVLLIEDVNEPAYRLDRMLNQLRQAGILGGLNALLCGRLCDDEAEAAQVDEILQEYACCVPGPVLADVPYGHTPDRRVLPLGYAVCVQGNRWGRVDFLSGA